MKQTAVEWLFKNIWLNPPENLYEILDQAKEMEKQQIQEAFYRGIQEQTQRVLFKNPEITEPDKYYTKTYETE